LEVSLEKVPNQARHWKS